MRFFKRTGQMTVLKKFKSEFESELVKNNISFKEIAIKHDNPVSIYSYSYTRYNEHIVLFIVKDIYQEALEKI